MRVKHKFPPNYEEIIKHLPWVAEMPHAIFTYETTIYVPSGNEISKDLEAHEWIHSLQQKDMGVKKWWNQYYIDSSFRLSQETEAYRNQYQYGVANYNRHYRRQLLKKISDDLSGPLYGSLITKEEAKELIMQE